MAVQVVPAERCILNFDYDGNFDFSDVKWLGFDKFENLIYGYRLRFHGYEIYKLSVFGRKIQLIKRFPLQFALISELDFTSAISSCGGYILFYHYSPRVNGKSSILSMFSVETNETEIYQFLSDFTNAVDGTYQIKIYHNSSIGWICVVQFLKYTGKFAVHRIAFNDSDKTGRLEYLTELEENDRREYCPVLCGRNIFFVSNELNFVKMFDFQTKSWSSKTLMIPTIIQHRSFIFVCVSEADQSIIAVPRCCVEYSPIFKMVEGVWEETSLCINLVQDSNKKRFIRIINEDSFCSSNTFFMSSIVYDSSQKPKNFALCANTNVLSLKNLAAKKLFDSISDVLSDRKIMEIMNLPHILNRQYFGPKWIW